MVIGDWLPDIPALPSRVALLFTTQGVVSSGHKTSTVKVWTVNSNIPEIKKHMFTTNYQNLVSNTHKYPNVHKHIHIYIYIHRHILAIVKNCGNIEDY